MKNLLSLIIFIIPTLGTAYAQCVIEPFSIEKRNEMSSLVVEGRVTNKVSKWNSGKDFIFTVNTVEVFKVFKGEISSTIIEIITEGGQIESNMITAHPALELQIEETGVYFLKESKLFLFDETAVSQRFLPVASVQSFIKYDLDLQIAHDYSQVFPTITSSLYSFLTGINGHNYKILKDVELDPWKGKIRPLATPVITTLSHDTISAGTYSLLTITGSNFGFARVNGGVYFVDADYGDGRTFAPKLETSYKSWSSTKIEVYVPSHAGTGKIKVINSTNESGLSSKTLYIKYAHLNATYGSSTVDTQYFMVDHVNKNSKGGFYWSMNPKFKAKPLAVNSFLRSLETWRCGTLINMEIGNDSSKDTILYDNVNLVRFTASGDSRLGVCYYYWLGCFDGTNWLWYVEELDIQFDSVRSWYYGTGTPSSFQMDFQSVATHELGHGHQLGHVIDNTKIMHYSIGLGQRKVALHKYDLEGGNFVMSNSVKSNGCGPSKMIAISPLKCTITKPKANFGVSKKTVCPGKDITVTDSSEGIINSYAWDFGANASPATATGIGPHTFNYSVPGIKTIQLVTSNDFGKDTLNITVTIEPFAPVAPFALPYNDSICIGQHKYHIKKVKDANTYLWSLPAGGGSIIGTNSDTFVTVSWTGAGAHDLNVFALNSCGNSLATTFKLNIYNLAKVGFTQVMDGRNVTFTNTSANANMFKWFFGDGDSSILKDPFHVYASANTYNVKLVSSNFCSSEEKVLALKVSYGAGLFTVIGSGKFIVYPNPVTEKAIIKLEGIQGENYSVRIAETTGKTIHSQKIDTANETAISLIGLAKGLYAIELLWNGIVIGSQKLIKE